MGWTDGTKVGKRARMMMSSTTTTTEEEKHNSSGGTAVVDAAASEGLWITKRQDGLGIGAEGNALREASSRYNHVGDFANVLASLQQHSDGSTSSSTKKKKRKREKEGKSSSIVKEASIRSVATNRMTHAKVRKAKFASKSEEDMKCIFAGATPIVDVPTTTESKPKKDKKKKKEKKNKEKKSSKKKSESTSTDS